MDYELESQDEVVKVRLAYDALRIERDRLAELFTSARDALAEALLKDQHSRDWYIGEATDVEWAEVYAEIDYRLGFVRENDPREIEPVVPNWHKDPREYPW